MRACNNHSPSTGDVCRFLHPCSAGSCNATSLQPFNPSIRTPVGHNATRNKLDKSASVLKPPFYMKIGIFLFFYHDGLPCAVLRAAAGAGPQGCAYSDGQSCWTAAMELVQGPGVCATRLGSWALFYCKRGLVSSHGLNAYFLLVCVRSDPGGTISSSLCDMGAMLTGVSTAVVLAGVVESIRPFGTKWGMQVTTALQGPFARPFLLHSHPASQFRNRRLGLWPFLACCYVSPAKMSVIGTCIKTRLFQGWGCSNGAPA